MTTILHILQHALGRDEYGRPTSRSNPDYRNHYCAGEGHDGFDLCRSAVATGLMTEHAPSALSGGDYIFTVTDRGRAFIATNSPKPPKVSRGKARYLRWLALECDMTFGEWLKADSREEQR